MVTWPTLTFQPATTHLFASQNATRQARMVVYVEQPSAAEKTSGVTLPDVWPLAGTRVLLLRPDVTYDWPALERAAQRWPEHRIGWTEQSGEPALRLDVAASGAVADYDLFARNSAGARTQIHFVLSRAAQLTLATDRVAAKVSGAVDLVVLENQPVRVQGDRSSLQLDLSAEQAGVLSFDILADDAVLRALSAEIRFFVRGNSVGGDSEIDELRYALLAPNPTKPVSLRGAFDPMLPLEQIRLGLDGATRVASHLMTDEGERLELEAQTARFASQASPTVLDAGGHTDDTRLYFTPLGTFSIVPPPSRADGKNPKAFRVVTGLAGGEFIEIPGFDADPTARLLSFELGPALFMDAPWDTDQARSANAYARRAMAHDASAALGKTAWVVVGAATANLFSQTQRAPLFCGSETALRVGGRRVVATASDVLLATHTQVTVGASAALPIAPLGGTQPPGSAGYGPRDPYTLAAQRIAPKRLLEARAKLARPTGALTAATTPQGFVVGVKDGGYQSVKLATGALLKTATGAARGASSPIEFSFEIPATSVLRDELLHSEVALAWSCWDVDPPAGTAVTRLVAEQWEFDANLGAAASSYDPLGGVTLFKFHSGTLRELIVDPHTYREHLNRSPEQTRQRVLDLLAPALSAPAPPPPEDWWAPLRAILDDPTWTGIVVLNGKIATPPDELAGLLANMDDTLRVTYLAVPLNRVDGTLTQKHASVGGLIDYSNQRSLDRAEYDLVVRSMRVLFTNNAVERFECRVDLKAEQMFFEVTDIARHPTNVITFHGHYEAHGPQGGPTYTFATDDGEKFTFKPRPPSIFREIVIDRLTYVTETTEDVDANHKMVHARISLRGQLSFGDDVPRFGDIFSFDGISFDDLALKLGTLLPKLATSGGSFDHIDFHAPDITLDLKAQRRAKSLFRELPLKLKGLIARLKRTATDDILALRGFFRLGQTSGALPNFAFVFAFDLGTLGGLVGALKGLSIDVAIGWNGAAPVFGIKLPDIGGGERAFGVEGVLRILVEDLEFHRTTADKFFLLLRKAQLELLGVRLPPDSAAIGGLIIADAERTKPAWIVTAEYPKPRAAQRAPAFLAIGQSIDFATTATTAKGVVDELETCFTPYSFADGTAPPPDAEKVLDRGALLKYAPDHDWLCGLRLPLAAFLGSDAFKGELDVIFDDPSLYGLYAEFFTLKVDLLYRRVADGVGMFYVDLPLPFGPISAGAMTIALPNVGICVLTDGGFKLDLGFPANMDFARAFRLEMLPFGGAGGLYFARFRTAGSDLLTSTATRRYVAIWQAGFGLRVGLAASLSVGPFSASASISIYAMLEGALGFVDDASGSANAEALDLAVRGRFGIMASLQCHLDLVVTALEFGIDIWVGVELVARLVDRRLQPIDVTFQVGVRVRVRWVIARFKIFGHKIEIAITLSFERTISYHTQLGGGGSRAQLRAHDLGYLQACRAGDVWRAAIADPADATPISLVMYFVPEVAITASRAARVIALIAVECAPAPDPKTAPPATPTPFDELIRKVVRWAARVDGAKPSYAREDVRAWRDRLKPSHSTAAAGLTYDVICAFLAAHTRLSFEGHPPWTEGQASTKALAMFPVFSEHALTVDGQAHPFTASRYTQVDQQMLHDVLRSGTDRDDDHRRLALATLTSAPDAGQPLAELIMQEYFEALVKLSVAHLADVATDVPATLEALIGRLRAPTSRDPDAFAAIAASVSAQTMHGQRVPAPANPSPADPRGTSVYERTNQSVVLFDSVPSVPISKTVSLDGPAGGPGGAFSITRTMTRQEDFAELLRLDAVMRDPHNAPDLGVNALVALDLVTRRRRSFALATHATYSDAPGELLFGLPAELQRLLERRDTSLQVGVYTATADDNAKAAAEPVPAPLGFWLLRLDVQVRKPPEKQADKSIFEVLGADDRSRRALDRYFAHQPGAASEVHVYVRQRAAALAAGDAPPPALTPLASAQTLCVMMNTARRSNPGTRLSATTQADDMPVSATPNAPNDFLRLLWSASIVRDAGFALKLPINETTLDWDGAGRATVVVTVKLAPTSEALPRWANAVRLPRVGVAPAPTDITSSPAPTTGYSIQPLLNGSDEDLFERTPRAKPGFLTLQLVRPDPDRTHGSAPALGIRAGLRSHEIREVMTKRRATLITAPARHVDLEQDRVHVQSTYRLLALRIPAVEPATVFRRAIAPRALDPAFESDVDALASAAAGTLQAGDWTYRYVLDLTSLSPGPYARIGSTTLDFALSWRDGYGNDAPGWSATSSVPVLYRDRIIPAAEWPRVTMRWAPDATGATVGKLTLRYTPRPQSVGPDPRDEAASVREHADWATIAAQLADPGMGIVLELSLLAASIPLTRAQQDDLEAWAAGIRDAPHAARLWEFELQSRLFTTRSRTRIELGLRLTRPKYVAPGMPEEVSTVVSSVPILVPDAAAGGMVKLAADLSKACPPLVLALGEPQIEQQERSLWAVQRAMLSRSVVKQPGMFEWARFFAPAPLSTELISVADRPVPRFDKSQADGLANRPLAVRGVDADGLLRAFLVDVEAALRSDAFVRCRATADAAQASAMDGIVRAKFRMADALAKTVHPLFAGQAVDGLDEARVEFKEAVRKDLRKAYEVDTVVQYEFAATSLPGDTGQLLYADLVVASPDRFGALQVSRGRMWLCPRAARVRLTMLVDAIADNHPSMVHADVGLRVTHVAEREDGACGDDTDRYVPMRWLQLVTPDQTPTPLTVIGLPAKLQIPLPRREPPKPPTISGHQATPWQVAPTDLAASRRWRYTVSYAHEGRQGDQVLADVRFERYSPVPVARALGRTDSLEDLCTALAGWRADASAVLAAIETSRTSGTTPGPDAMRAYGYLAHVARAVADALPGAVTTPMRASDANLEAVDRLSYPADAATAALTGPATQLLYDATPTSLVVGGRNALDAVHYAAATAELRLRRNATLLGDLATDPRFIYTTERIAAGDWVHPNLQPSQLFAFASIPVTGASREEALRGQLRTLLTTLSDGQTLDVSLRASFVFDPTGSSVTTIDRLDRATIVPLAFLPQRMVPTGGEVDAFAGAVHRALPAAVYAANAGVLVEVTVFTHATVSARSETPARRVLTVRGAWFPLQSLSPLA